MKCRPLKNLTNGLGAVRLTRTAGWKELPTPSLGGPVSMSQDDGASTDVTGTLVSWSAWITAGNGSRISPEKLKPVACVRTRRGARASTKPKHHGIHEPKMASTTWSDDFRADPKSSTNGTFKSSSCLASRCEAVSNGQRHAHDDGDAGVVHLEGGYGVNDHRAEYTPAL